LLTLRCPGISLFPLVPHFKRAIGVDPSEGMISEAGGAWEAYCGSALQGKRPDTLVEFKQGSAEKLTCIDDASVDLVTAAQVRAQQP
jgi:ubiquinone/menaquinone biosynthesis C-methylase UbiE